MTTINLSEETKKLVATISKDAGSMNLAASKFVFHAVRDAFPDPKAIDISVASATLSLAFNSLASIADGNAFVLPIINRFKKTLQVKWNATITKSKAGYAVDFPKDQAITEEEIKSFSTKGKDGFKLFEKGEAEKEYDKSKRAGSKAKREKEAEEEKVKKEAEEQEENAKKIPVAIDPKNVMAFVRLIHSVQALGVNDPDQINKHIDDLIGLCEAKINQAK